MSENEINEEEVFEKKEKKLKLPNLFKNKKSIAIIIVLVIAIILVSIELTTNCITNLIYSSIGTTGNTIGNISNCGYSVAKGDYIYFVAPSDDMNTTNIYKVKNGSSDIETIYEGAYDIRGLNIIGNNLYFINISFENATEEDDQVDNKIYKMNLDSSNLTVINDNDFSYDSYDLYAIGNRIYYVGEDYNVYKMDLNGGSRELVAETGTGLLAIDKDYIIYNKDDGNSDDYVTYIKSLKNGDERTITGGRIFTPDIYNGYIYYLTDDQGISKISVNGGDSETVLDGQAYNLNIYNDTIYYLNYKNEENEDYTVCIYKMNINGGDPEIVKEFSYYSSFINLVNDYIYYMDMDDEKAFINLINVNDSTEIELHNWNYNDTGSADQSYTAEDTENISEEVETSDDVQSTPDESEQTETATNEEKEEVVEEATETEE